MTWVPSSPTGWRASGPCAWSRGANSQAVMPRPLPPPYPRYFPTICFLVLWPKSKRQRLGVGGQQASGTAIFTGRQWLACLSSETCNFIVSRECAEKTLGPLSHASCCWSPGSYGRLSLFSPYTYQEDHLMWATHSPNVASSASSTRKSSGLTLRGRREYSPRP